MNRRSYPARGGWGNVGRPRELIRGVSRLIDTFNEMLIEIASLPAFPHVRYVNLRGTLPTGANYKEFWANELHPTEEGFSEVTRRFAEVLQSLP